MNLQSVEDDIRAIPGNGPVLEELYKILESGEALAMVGAGASAGLWPLWDEFLQGFIEHGLEHDRINQAEADFLRKEAPQTPLETAQQLRNKIGDPLYFEYIERTFSDKLSPQTGGAYTLTHQALLQLPIHNYLTLNYDAGLTNARAALYPKATTSYFFWDQEEARRILDGNHKRQVLHAHGRHDRADSIILTLDDYRKAYNNRAFVRLLDKLFAYEKLIIVGFGLSDPYIKQLFNNISGDYKKSPLRHIAFVGLDDADIQVATLLRERVEMVYGAHILFYPTRDHHKALTDWLTTLADKYRTAAGSRTAEEIEPLAFPPQLKEKLPDLYVHQPTDDDHYQGRAENFATLNRWADDPATRTIAMTGIGGQGKTALVGRWLRQERSPQLAQAPVFYWSFYEDLDVGKFLEQVVEFCLPVVRVGGTTQIEPISFIISLAQEIRLVLVLDGLEVLQEEADSPAHGEVHHPLLRPLLQHWVRHPHQGLMILTSRFQFPQLARFRGVGFHHLNLVRLSEQDGISLLGKLGLRGETDLLGAYVEQFHGHPLALRVLASTVKRSCFGDLAQFEGGSILTADATDPLSQKLERLLGFYERQLQGGQQELLGIISLFKRPVALESFVTLLAKMTSLKDTPLADADAAIIEQQLKLLIDDFLIEQTPAGITTHPVIRDYFRSGHKLAGSRREVADFLKERPGAERPQTIEEVRDLVEAVQLLCDEGEFEAADDLLKSRLSAGGYGFNVFKNLPALNEGLECDLAFVGDETRERKVEETLGKWNVAIHCSGVSLYNHLLGNLAQAREWQNRSLEICRQRQQTDQQARALHNISIIEMVMGNIREARETVSQALGLSHENRISSNLRTEFANKAYCDVLLGDTSQAYQDFEIGLCYEQKESSDERFLSSIWGNHQAEFFIRLQAWKPFDEVNAWNIQRSEINQWNDKLAVCHLLQGWYEICRGRLSQAEEALAKAERILRPSGILEQICRLDWVWALLDQARGEYRDGLQRVSDSLLTCADKGFRLWQADHFVLRGRLLLLQFESADQQDNDVLEKAGDDGNEALRIAEDTGYVWARLEALDLLASYHHTRAALRAFNKADEKESARRYAKEAASLKSGLLLTSDQMKALKAKARKTFDEQTAGWED